MGNCLDIPPPHNKRRPVRIHEDHYIRNGKTTAVAPGQVQFIPNDYSVFPAFDEIPPITTVDSADGQLYSYPADFVQPQYDHEVDVKRVSRYMKHQRKSELVTHNGDIPDKNSNTRLRNENLHSTVITTFDDPREDVITRGHEIVVANGHPRSQNGVIATITSGAIRTSVKTVGRSVSVMSSSTEALGTAANQNIVVQSQVISAPVAKRGSTYITYIEDEPPPPSLPPEPLEETTTTTEVVEEILVSKTEQLLETNQTEDGFIEAGTADETTVQLFIDEPVTQTSVVKETSTMVTATNWLKRFGSSYRSSFPRYDIALCYDSTNATDASVMFRIRREIETAGFGSAIADAGAMDWPSFSEAVIDAKIMVVVLSAHSIKNNHVRDLISLAHVTETSIYPVVLGESIDILGGLSIGLKLQLASYNWTELKEGTLSLTVDAMVQSLRKELEIIKSYEIIDEDYGEVSSWAQRRRKIVRRHHIQRFISYGSQTTALIHWDKMYASGVNSVMWERFYRDLRIEYQDMLASTVPKSCSPYLMANIKREIGVGSDGLVHKVQFVEFCTESDTDLDVWEKIHTIARETQAIRDVFDEESTVRMVAIENIGKFGSQNVVSALQELLKDRENKIRAAAAISLSHCFMSGDRATLTAIKALLDDRDALVREAGCLALGHLRAHEAVEKLKYLRHNDSVIQVRKAASTALNDIQGIDINKE